MALGDYILCCKCEVKLIYDGDRGQREWWEERFGKEPEIECPDCKPQRPSRSDIKPLTENEIKHLWYEACQTNLELTSQLIVHLARNIEAAHGIKENT